ncbi:hypothetical protein RclHR1_01880008 [Rhizophagus clarus]|uniref:BTB/POZ protein n=1 Tax=Rhizophagus clarus TaxID=94130 RepID=A0A2Z6QN01_9GLOM|nr:hypothetical protein RclHR1_01880008 [Rhizophagus clarus]GES90249.1 BTB/POZ protein [Rhizophagus clarus]
MLGKFFDKLSQNYIEILDDDKYYDITIEVGRDPYVKIFRAHMIILYYRLPFLRRILVSNRSNRNYNCNDVLTHIKLPSVTPEIFEIILKYIYGGTISLNEKEPSIILEVLVAAGELLLQELVDYLQRYLIIVKSEWLEQNFELTLKTSFQSNSLLELQEFCTDFMAKSPEKVFNLLDFTSLPENSLVSLIKRDDLQMKEVEIWEHVLKWGLEKNPSLLPDPMTWLDDDFKIVENTMQHCLPFIRFFSLSSKDFFRKVHPYRKLLKPQLYEELLNSYLEPGTEPKYNILLPRYRNIDGILCDDIPHTVTFIKIKGAEEIIGGYNPLVWESNNNGEWGKTMDSFIFSFKSKTDFKDPILSHVKNMDHALFYCNEFGPAFGDGDINIHVKDNDDSKKYDCFNCIQYSYEKKIRNEKNFLIRDYEVFQIIKKD